MYWNWLCKKYIKRIEELEKELSSLQDKYNQLKEDYDKDSKYYIERIKTLEEVIARSIEIPDITTTVAQREPINVYEDARFKKYDFVAADIAYYKIPLEQWKILLSLIYNKFQKVHPYIPEIWDCDDFALFYAGILAYAAKLAKLDMQLAFAIAWSSSHAFNLFVALDGKIWVYEPQNNSIVGQINEVSEPYIVRMIWFMG